MKNVTLSLDEKLLAESREYARRHGTTLNAWIRELLRQNVERSDADWVDGLLVQLDEADGHSNGWKWDRESIYER